MRCHLRSAENDMSEPYQLVVEPVPGEGCGPVLRGLPLAVLEELEEHTHGSRGHLRCHNMQLEHQHEGSRWIHGQLDKGDAGKRMGR